MKRFVFIVIILLSTYSVYYSQSVQEIYIMKYCQIAIDEMNRTGVPASITLAQGILESGSGTSQLAMKANNHFGIKCHKDWTGGKTYMDDDAKNECFRTYENPSESFRDHSDFLRNNQRYASLFEFKTTDYKSWAHGLKKAGYATNPVYATRLIEIIENYGLAKYDSGVIPLIVNQEIIAEANNNNENSNNTKPVKYYSSNGFELNISEYSVGSNNHTQYIVLKYATDINSLSKKLGMAPWQLPKYNDLPKNAKLQVGDLVYLKPKRNKADKNHKEHIVAAGETMRDISQKYAVKIKSLYKLNAWEEGAQPVEGSKMKLR